MNAAKEKHLIDQEKRLACVCIMRKCPHSTNKYDCVCELIFLSLLAIGTYVYKRKYLTKQRDTAFKSNSKKGVRIKNKISCSKR